MRFSSNLLAAYLDALAGLSRIREEVIQHQNDKIAGLKETDPEKATEEFMDQQPMSHALEEPGESKLPRLLHRATQADFKKRTSPSGADAQFLGWMVITLLYGSWEDNYREKLAIKLGHKSKRDLRHDLFGDLGQLRHAVLHHNGVATRDFENAKVLKWFRRGETIFISYDHADFLLDQIDSYVSQLCTASSA
jgi:hypothetical protein